MRLAEAKVMADSIYAFVDGPRRAHDIVHELKGIGFPISEISVVMPDRPGEAEFETSPDDGTQEGAAAGAATGGVMGGVLGWLVGAGTLTLPGVGVLLAAGPALAALSGVAAGAAAGGLTGALIAMGLPESEADRAGQRVSEGRILISVATRAADQEAIVEDVFEKHGATDISAAGEKS